MWSKTAVWNLKFKRVCVLFENPDEDAIRLKDDQESIE